MYLRTVAKDGAANLRVLQSPAVCARRLQAPSSFGHSGMSWTKPGVESPHMEPPTVTLPWVVRMGPYAPASGSYFLQKKIASFPSALHADMLCLPLGRRRKGREVTAPMVVMRAFCKRFRSKTVGFPFQSRAPNSVR